MTRILVVDDSPTIRRVVTHILEVGGFDTVEAVDGQDAIDVLKSGEAKVDLVLLDFVMPRMNGFQFCRAIAKEPDFSALPVILMSAKSDRIRAQFVEQTGSVDAIGKPFDADALLTVVENAFARKKGDRASLAIPTVRASSPNGAAADAKEDDVIVLDSIPPEGAPDDDDAPEPTVMGAATPAILLAAQLEQLLQPMFAPGVNARAAITEALTGDVMRDLARMTAQLAQEPRPLGGGSAKNPVLLAGDLSVLPAGAILQLLQSESQTGRLVAENGKSEITATFRGGLIDLVQSKGAGDEFRLGRYFVEAGIVSAVEIDALARGESPQIAKNKHPTSSTGEIAAATPRPLPIDGAEAITSPGSKSGAEEAAPATMKAIGADARPPESSVLVKAAAIDLTADEDAENFTQIAASAFKREVPMPIESAPTVDVDDVEDLEEDAADNDDVVDDDEATPLGSPDDETDLAKAADADVAEESTQESVPPNATDETPIASSVEADDDEAATDSGSEVLSSRLLVDQADSSPPMKLRSSPPIGPLSETEQKAFPPSRPRSEPPVAPLKERMLLGDALVSAGLITQEQLREALVRQSSELIYELLRWKKGRFELVRAEPPALAERTKLGLPVAQVVMEGFRRVDEWRALETSVGDFESVLVRDEVVVHTMKDDAITRSEKLVLEQCDGERTVREIIASCHMSSFDACRVIAQLLEARLVRRRVEPSAP